MRNRQSICMGLSMAALAAASVLAALSVLDAAQVRTVPNGDAAICRSSGLDWCPSVGLKARSP